ncbi:hypothetical protein OROMI_032972 [Orobanche minor]
MNSTDGEKSCLKKCISVIKYHRKQKDVEKAKVPGNNGSSQSETISRNRMEVKAPSKADPALENYWCTDVPASVFKSDSAGNSVLVSTAHSANSVAYSLHVILFCGIRGGEGEGGRVSSSPLSPSTTSTSTRLSKSMRLSKGHDGTLTMGSPENKSSFSSQEGFSGRTGSSFSVIHSSSESISSTTMGSISFLLLMLLSLSLKLYFT